MKTLTIETTATRWAICTDGYPSLYYATRQAARLAMRQLIRIDQDLVGALEIVPVEINVGR